MRSAGRWPPRRSNRGGRHSSPSRDILIDSLIAALADRGWAVGNLVVDVRYMEGDPNRAEALARERVDSGTDVIVTNVTATAMAAPRASPVMVTSLPVEGGLATSPTRPGGNVTGLTIYAGAARRQPLDVRVESY